MSAGLGIGEVARRAGIAASAIRYYEKEGLLPAPPRRSGRRRYELDVLDRLALIELAKRAGFTVAEIGKLLRGFSARTTPGQRWRAMTRAKRGELDARIEEARRMRRVLELLEGCDCPSLHDCAALVRGARRDRH